MPEKDLETVKNVWLDTQEKIISGDYEHFTKSSDRMISHVRPKGRDSEDLMITPQGTKEKKKCFWLNRDYVMSIIE
jgi:DNA mismatch repair protein MutH